MTKPFELEAVAAEPGVRCDAGWLGASVDPERVAEMSQRLDAVLEFTTFVSRQFLLGDYSLESHESDVFDQFQLQYLTMDRFVHRDTRIKTS